MFDAKELRKAVLAKSGKEVKKAQGWRLVPVGYLVEYLEERAAISEHDGGMTRESAERAAIADGERRFKIYELVFE